MKREFMKVIVDLFTAATPNPQWSPSGSTSNGYVINAYGDTVEQAGNDFTPEKAVFYNRTFMKNHRAKLVHTQFGEKLTMPKHSGGVVNIRGMSPYSTATTPLQEGVTPAPNTMDFYYIEIPVNQYGKFTPITDIAAFATRDDVLVHDAEELSSQSGRTIEELAVEGLNAGTEVYYAPKTVNNVLAPVSARSGIDTTAKLTVDLIFRAVNFLEVQNAEAIDGSYVAIIHPNVKYDIMRNEEFISIVKYNDASRIYRGEIGMIGNVRFVVSPFAKKWAGAGTYISGNSGNKVDVYSTLILGKGAYKTVEIEGEGMQTIIKGFGSGGTADPLNQRATQGWKTTFGIGITNECAMVRIESASALSTATRMTGVSDNYYRLKNRSANTNTGFGTPWANI